MTPVQRLQMLREHAPRLLKQIMAWTVDAVELDHQLSAFTDAVIDHVIGELIDALVERRAATMKVVVEALDQKGTETMKLDAKFDGVIFKTKDRSIVPPDEYVVFLAKDDAFASTLAFYEKECERLGADERQLAAVRAMRARVEEWRKAHPGRCKVPDIAEGEKLLIPSDVEMP